MDGAEEEKIKLLIYREFSCEQVPEALEMLGSRKTYGK